MLLKINTACNNLNRNVCLPKNGKGLFMFFILLILAVSANAQEKYIDSIKARIYHNLESESRSEQLDEIVTGTRKLLINKDSCWSDLHYEAADPTHLGRVVLYAKAYANPGSRWYHNDWVYGCIVKTLVYWFKIKRVHWNWYCNVIGAPINTGQVLILMDGTGSPLPAALTKRLVASMDFRAAADRHCSSGANQTDVALHYLYRGCLTRNQAVIDSAARNSVGRIDYLDNKDGIQYDNSFYAHGPQEQIGSYGSVYVYDLYNIAYYLHDTPFALKGRRLAILSSYYLNTYLKSIRHGYFDFGVLGRRISRRGGVRADSQSILDTKVPQADPGKSIIDEKIALIDPGNLERWKTARAIIDEGAATDYLINPVHNQFWKSDYVQHIRPLYSFNVRMSSVRTSRTEAGNKENFLGGFLADGATCIQRRGNEYFNIMPVWEWDKIPGTTAPDCPGDTSATIPKEWGMPGTAIFAGGVSDGKYGASAYAMQHKGVSAKKAWFFFDKEVVCMGAGIHATDNINAITTINQCWLHGAVTVGNANRIFNINTGEDQTIDHPSWLLHDSIGYFFPSAQHLRVSTVTQTGSWSRINKTQSAEPVSGPVFKAWLEHKTSDGNYAYIVVPGLNDIKAMRDYDQQQVEILANTDAVQAVMRRGLDILQVVLYKPGKFHLGDIAVKVDQPCILMITGVHSRNSQLYVADPQQSARKITIELTMPGHNALKPIMAAMPAGVYAGSTTAYRLDENGFFRLPDIRNGIIEEKR